MPSRASRNSEVLRGFERSEAEAGSDSETKFSLIQINLMTNAATARAKNIKLDLLERYFVLKFE
jgi:hypothetical protein